MNKTNPKFLLISFCVLLALAVVDTVLVRSSIVQSFNMTVFSVINGVRLHLPWFTSFVFLVTHLGSDPILFVVVIALAVAFVRRRMPAESVWIIATAVSARVVGWTAKILIESPRPDLIDPPLRVFAGFGFPSGHALMSTAILGAAAFLIAGHTRSGTVRLLSACLYVLLISAIGVSRIYLGAHWANDVLGGYLYGGCVLTAALLVRGKCAGQSFEIRG